MRIRSTPLLEEVRARQRRPTPERTREIRQLAEVTRERLGAEVGVTGMTIWRWESGRQRPSGDPGEAYYVLLAELARLVAPPAQ